MSKRKGKRRNKQNLSVSTGDTKGKENETELKIENDLIELKKIQPNKKETDNQHNEIDMDNHSTAMKTDDHQNHMNSKNKRTESKEKIVDMELNEIKSTAVVKYSVPRIPDYIKLQCNTDLNLPPANWLSSSADSYGLQRAFTLTHKGFASFRMAQMYPDCVGDVDVISDAENIKKLLKIPYTKEVVSMFVHRVGNTLLIDNFDIYKNFARTKDGVFLWLRDFVMKHLSAKAIQDERRIYTEIRSREALKHRSLISKFMYHSLDMNQSERMLENEVNQARSSRSFEDPVLPNPSPDVEAPDSTFDDKYNRDVVWTFEDIEMLLGTDMPIFGGGEYPCISLRLRDMKQPINVLTGIDYWLDNLMSNVPEVVMCYHLNGFVQKYELIKTEDLPQLKNSKFSPQLIKDVAQNILSFLKTNATKAGHTYWLFKDKEADFIKLYDLTCLVPQNDKLQNPFTIPVAMLLYRVARNFMKSTNKRSGVIKMLLENCIKLLPEDKYPEIVTSSYFMLSEIYLPITTNPEAPTFDKEDPDQDRLFENDNEDINEEAIKVLDLETAKEEEKKKSFKPPPPIDGGADYRCLKALSNIHRGLNCLQYFSDEPLEPMPMGSGIPSAKCSEPIPMGYEKLNENKKEGISDDAIEKVEQGNVMFDKDVDTAKKGVIKKADSKSRKKKTIKQEPDLASLLVMNNKKTEPLPTWKKKNARQDGMSWKTHLKNLLYEKAVLVFATLSEFYFGKHQYDNCFRNIRLLARCSLIMRKLNGSIQFNEECILGRAGDCCIRIFLSSQEPQSHLRIFRENIFTHTRKECEMLTQIMSDEDPEDPVYSPNLMCVYDCDFETPEAVIHLAVVCYEEALKVSVTDNMLRRLGNALNEAGAYYLNYAKIFNGEEEVGTWAKKAEVHLLKALDAFEKIKDKENMALLNTNLGHMYRLIGFSYSLPGRALTLEEKSCYAKSNEYFRKAFKILGKRHTNPQIWDNVNWELSSSLFSEASLMQDNPPDDVDSAKYNEKVLKALTLALESCDTDKDHSKFANFRNRIALIKCRMASIHHKLFLSNDDPVFRKKMFTLAEREYQWAVKYFLEVVQPLPYFRTQLKLFILYEEMAENIENNRKKLEFLNTAVEIFVEIAEMIQLILMGEAILIPSEKNFMPTEEEKYLTFRSLMDSFMKEFQNILISILKIYSQDKSKGKKLIEIYKECYRITLTYSNDFTPHNVFITMYEILNKIRILITTTNFK